MRDLLALPDTKELLLLEKLAKDGGGLYRWKYVKVTIKPMLREFNPLQPSVAFLYPLKTSQKQHWTVMS